MKAVLHYLFLVGLPVLGVLALLQAGAGLKAPLSVGGTWALEINTQPTAGPACAALTVPSAQPLLTISQSGPHLRLSLNDEAGTLLLGEIKDTDITAGAGTQITFQAVVDPQAEPDRLQGALTIGDCLVAAPLTAVRQPAVRDSKGGH